MAPFGRYQLLRRLGRGGMAEVFLARMGQGPVAKLLAIKRLLPAYSQNHRLVQRLADEARLTVWLTHPNIIQVFDFGRFEDSYFIAMEYVDGCDLRSLIQPASSAPIQLPLEVALEVGYRLLDALRYAHGCTDAAGKPLGIIHRDVSPHNVLISRDGHPKLADFGVARAISTVHQTQPGAVLGKQSYMAPEQARGKDYDARVDVYAAGATLYLMLTGSKPFPDRTLADGVLEQLPPPPSSHRPSISPALDRLLLRSLAPAADERFPSAAAMADAVLEQLQEVGGPPRPHQICRLVQESQLLRDARRKGGNASDEPRVTRSDMALDQDSLIGAEVTQVQQHFFPRGPEPPRTVDNIEQAETPEPPRTVDNIEQAETPAPPRTVDNIEQAETPAPAPDLPMTTPWLRVSEPPAPRRWRRVEDWLATVVTLGERPLPPRLRLWLMCGLAASATLVIFGIGLLVGRATVSRECRPEEGPRTAVSRPAPRAVVLAPPTRQPPPPTEVTTGEEPGQPATSRPAPGVPPTARPRATPRRVRRARRRATARPASPSRQVPEPTPIDPLRGLELLQQARSAYVDGYHALAMHRARQSLRHLPDSPDAWQVIGAASCYLGRKSEARAALLHLRLTARKLVISICRRNKIQL